MLALDQILDHIKLFSIEMLIVLIKVLVIFVVGLVGTMLMVAVFLLIVGCLIDPTSATLILTPLLVPIVKSLGVDLAARPQVQGWIDRIEERPAHLAIRDQAKEIFKRERAAQQADDQRQVLFKARRAADAYNQSLLRCCHGTPLDGGRLDHCGRGLFNRPRPEDVTVFTRDLALLLRAGASDLARKAR